MRIAGALHDELVAHAREDAPNECCGLIASRDGEAVQVIRVTNSEHSPLRFEMDAMEMYRALMAIEDDGLDVGAIYHSHTRSAPQPSQMDINMANRNWPDPLWIIVGTKEPEVADVRAWRITGADVEQVPLDVVR